MKTEETIEKVLVQAGNEEAQEIFSDLMRSFVRIGILEAMKAEVELLCGPRYQPDKSSDFVRAGSEKGQIYTETGKEEIRRPRVRSKEGEEVQLETYRQASSQRNLFDQVTDAIIAGMPVRGVEKCYGGAVKKSQASEMWIEKSAEILMDFRRRSLLREDWVAIMLDGVFIGDEQCVVVAIGITADGTKVELDFEPGTSENAEVCAMLLERIIDRGFTIPDSQRLLACIDGAKALRKAVRRFWPDAVIQECLVHVERQTYPKMPKSSHEELKLRFKELREAQGKESGEGAFEELVTYVERHSDSAARHLREREERLLVFHRLDVSDELNTTFLNTNIIENVIGNWRKTTRHIKRWRLNKGDMVNRWTAVGLVEAGKGFKRVRGHKKLDQIVAALQKKDEDEKTKSIQSESK